MNDMMSDEALAAAWKLFEQWKGLNPDDLKAIMGQARLANKLDKQVKALVELAKAHQEYLDAVDDAPLGSTRRENAWNEKEAALLAVQSLGLLNEGA